MHFSPPPEVTKAAKKKIYKKSRRILKELISNALSLLASSNYADPENFGVIKTMVDNHMYYYGIRLENEKGEKVNVFNLSTYPVGRLDSFLENYWYDRNPGSVGALVYKDSLLPVFMENDELVCRQTWG